MALRIGVSHANVQTPPSGGEALTRDTSRPGDPTLANLIWRLWRHLSPRRRRQFALLCFLMVASALSEVISLGAVIPLMSVLTSPEQLFRFALIRRVAGVFDCQSPNQLVLPVTIAFAVAATIAGLLRLLLLRLSTRLVFACSADLSSDAYRRTLYQPYSVHIGRNTSTVITGIVHEVNTAASVLLALQQIATGAVLLIALMATLLAINPTVAVTASVIFGGSYLTITKLSRRRLQQNSERIARDQVQAIKTLQEGLGGIRDVILDGTQELYCNIYRKADEPQRLAYAENMYIGQKPRHAMETLGLVLIAMLAYAITRQPSGVAVALGTIGALAFGAQRLLPALQQMYQAWSHIAGSEAALRNVIGMLDQQIPPEFALPASVPLPFRSEIRLDSVAFRYGPALPAVLDHIDLRITKGAHIGLVGTTGSGKTTALDIVMGLLSPSEGRIVVDGVPLSAANLKAWQRAIAHVPQTVYLADTTFAENIAFGVDADEIDMERVRRSAKLAHIADFIESTPGGYNARVGERGVRLSGGQRQRIGIARALYKQASVLVLDEATSALDNWTERAVVESLKDLDRELTILVVAHRLSTVKECDTIVQLENGRIVAHGTYEQLLSSSSSFKRMAGVAI